MKRLGRVNEAFGSFIDGFKEKQNDYSVCFICHRERALYFANFFGYGKTLIIHSLAFLTAGSSAIVVNL